MCRTLNLTSTGATCAKGVDQAEERRGGEDGKGADLISACLAGLLKVWIETSMAVAAAILLANLWQLLHPRPSYSNTHTSTSAKFFCLRLLMLGVNQMHVVVS